MKTQTPQSVVLDVPVAFCLLTRIPMPRLPDAAFNHSARAVWAYPIVGAVLGAVAGCAGLILGWAGVPAAAAAGIVLVLLAIMTGAMHEDGLCDTADGFWGGTSPAKRLTIMKDSHIGTYGTVALLIVTGLRWVSYASLLPLGFGPIIAVSALSRAVMPVVMFALPHARDTGLSHRVGQPGRRAVAIGLILATIGAMILIGMSTLYALLGALMSTAGMMLLAKRKIGGQTGDVLGATQQITEVVILVILTATLLK